MDQVKILPLLSIAVKNPFWLRQIKYFYFGLIPTN